MKHNPLKYSNNKIIKLKWHDIRLHSKTIYIYSAALEVLEEIPNPDVVIVCCGGGGLVSGIAAAVSLAKVKGCRVYAVEPESGQYSFRHDVIV